eukprot:GHVL01038031.1.p1 GENE.GHVL01038031.1~~GHVL01038031.1.p1  ORF type:complete len:343 (+),score=79.64 GHVL01038031.1:30-1058(+)
MACCDDEFDFQEDLARQDARKRELQKDGFHFADIKRYKGRNSMVCRHWLRGTCMKGEMCEYLHQLDSNRMPECPVQQRYGKCTDSSCLYKHSDDKLICYRYEQGFCPLGPACKRKHDRLPASCIKEELYDWFVAELLIDPFSVPPLGTKPPPPDLGKRLTNVFNNSIQNTYISSTNQSTNISNNISTNIINIRGLPVNTGQIRCFHIKSSTCRNIQISQDKNVWATFPQGTETFRSAYSNGFTVILIFSANDNRCFCGYGMITSLPDANYCPRIWGRFSDKLGSNFVIKWIKQCQIAWHLTDRITNSCNDNRSVHAGRDCQEISVPAAIQLCRVLDSAPDYP